MLTANPILDLLTAALPGVDLADVARAYAAVVPHLKAPKRARKAGVAEPIDTATLGEAELFAHYKKTAPFEDLAFFRLRTVTFADTREAGAELARDCFDEAGNLQISRPEFYRRLRNLQDRWRRETREAEQRQREADRRALRMRILENIAASEAARARSRFAAVA